MQRLTTLYVITMFDRQEWSQILIPKTTKEYICKIAKAHNLKIWEVVDNSFQGSKYRLNNETEQFDIKSRLERMEKHIEIMDEQLSKVLKKTIVPAEFESASSAPKAERIDRYPTGLQ